MPIYEYACEKCGRVSSFLVRNTTAHEPPACPHCRSRRMRRAVSRFAAGTVRKGAARAAGGDGMESLPPGPEALDGGADGGMPDGPMPDPAALESMMSGMDENDPRSMGRVMRELAQQTGEPLEGEMEEVVRRLESGEDPDKIEEKMGDLPGGDAAGGGGDELYDG
jgi:putative FmdB family regulatory protein